ncbi:MAG: 4-carboxy-4-hydroxy-2-oxoadipate aldolase/oxaloacetate decarboxylase [Blastomonas sp.]
MTQQIRLGEDQLERAKRLGSATLHEAAGRIGALPSAIKPVAPGMRLAGPAYTVIVPAFDNLWIHRALYRASPGDILVVDTSGGIEAGYWGDILNEAAMVRGLGGLVINGGVRDTAGLAEMPFSVFSNGVAIRGTIKGFDVPAQLQQAISIGPQIVNPGDLIVGDRDGVVAIPQDMAAQTIRAGEDREADEQAKLERIRAGETTLDIYGFGEA